MLGIDSGSAPPLPPPGYRPLSPDEIAALEARGNAALGDGGWAGIVVHDDPPTAPFSADRIRNCRFYGRVLLPGRFAGPGAAVEEGMGPPLHPTGLYDSTLADCLVEPDALVKGNGLLSRVVVGEGAVVVGA